MTIESDVATLVTNTTNLTTAVTNWQATYSEVDNTSDASKPVSDLTVTALLAKQDNLPNVNNTSDADKPVSTAVAAALADKQSNLDSGVNIKTVNGESVVGSGNVVVARGATEIAFEEYLNRGNLRGLTPQAGDSTVVEGIGLLMFVASQVEPDDDETCFNTSAGQWLLRVPSPDILAAWALVEDSIRNELDEDEDQRIDARLTTLGVI